MAEGFLKTLKTSFNLKNKETGGQDEGKVEKCRSFKLRENWSFTGYKRNICSLSKMRQQKEGIAETFTNKETWQIVLNPGLNKRQKYLFKNSKKKEKENQSIAIYKKRISDSKDRIKRKNKL